MAGHLRIWEFTVAPGCHAEFEAMYGPDGDWAALFRQSPGFMGTTLLRDRTSEDRYLTIDRWESELAWRTFRSSLAALYEALDLRGETLTVAEREIGEFGEALGPRDRWRGDG